MNCLVSIAGALTLTLVGCGVSIHNVGDSPDDETGDSSGDGTGSGSQTGDGSGSSDSSTGGSTDGTGTGGGEPIEALDVLFVIDNSGSMGPHQRAMVPAVVAMTEQLEALGMDYRLGFTTTDDGNPWCGTTSPEAGQLVYSSCADRVAGFIDQSGQIDVAQTACLENCAFSGAELGLDPASGPWFGSDTELAEGRTAAEAVACLFPQGIDGCGFESPLSAANKSILRSETPSEAAFGFIRPEANLLVVIITDESDCSASPDAQAIFDVDGNQVFWHPDANGLPTSAICWNAGTVCPTNTESLYCEWQSYDINGNPLAAGADADAVLVPPTAYAEKLAAIRSAKQALNGNARVELAVVAGYGLDGMLAFSEADPQIEQSFGTGPGCSVFAPGSVACDTNADCAGIGDELCTQAGTCLQELTAFPPVRIEAVRETGTTPYRISICSNDWVSRFELIAQEMSQ